MARIAYVNGVYQETEDAAVSILDRGFQFADGVYEVVLCVNGALWDAAGHFARWRRSLDALEIAEPVSERALRLIIDRLLRRNRLATALVYMQATRGTAPRDHPFPKSPVAPSLAITIRPFDIAASNAKAEVGVAVVGAPDIRWGRVDIKSVSLLPNVLAKEAARRRGAAEALLHRDGVVTEGASSNAWIVTPEGGLVTHPLGRSILGGITRETVMGVAQNLQFSVEERPFTIDEAKSAREAFLTSATNLVTPIVRIDEEIVGNGAPGPVAKRLREAYIAHCAAT